MARRARCCVVSKAREPPAHIQLNAGDDRVGGGAAGLRRELEALSLGDLRKRAKAEGMLAADLEAAMDADDPEEAFVGFVLQKHAADGGSVAGSESLRHELAALGFKDLRKRAKADGMPAADLEDAMDADDPEEALRGWLVARHAPSATAEKSAQAARAVILAELQGLQLKDLRKRAKAGGADAVKLEEALDADDPESAVIELVLAVESEAAGADPSFHDPSEEPTAALRAKLSALRLKELRKRARDAGIDGELLEDAADSDEPKTAVIDLLVADQSGQGEEALRMELEALRLKELRAQAKATGISVIDLETAADSDDPKGAVIELLLAHKPASALSDEKPHFGTGSAQPPISVAIDARHVMLSYQWDHQAQVKRVHGLLTKLGVKCWMDISGGMGTDIYSSMAEGVSNASVVVCFMSQKYQQSENCTLEAKFAKQSGVEIIPVMVEGGGWRATGWLGLLTAGSLWVRLSDESQFEEGVRQLHGQIQKISGAAMPEGLDDATDEGTATATEAKEELERLRDDLTSTAESGGTAVLADPSQPATIPAGVPKLPPRFHTTEQIRELTRLVLSTTARDLSMPRVGFWGMGGIGKTVTGAAIVRDDRVRKHFHAIVWLPLGQTPVIAKLQNLCHMQCTGKELSPELSSDEKKEALQQAMKGKRVLLCLDDLWEEEHELELNFADASAGSKVLISTRMKLLLDGGHQVEVGLPSMMDSTRMILTAAGLDHGCAAPTGIREIADLCGRLPLALGIAGRLAASLGLAGADNWSGMIGVLKEELRESHSGGTEEGMIRASLRGLKGPVQEQANVKALLLMFAYVPEDTHCPLEVLLLMFSAVNEGSAVTMMHLRKWMRILVNRSLVLGTIDRPSVHDLVLDFAVAQHSKDELRQGHRAIVEAFRAARPADVHGRPQYDRTQKGSPLIDYVCHEVATHLTGGWEPDKQHDALATRGWLADVPQDEIVIAAGHVLGCEQVADLADAAESAKDFWLAARYWSIVQNVMPAAVVSSQHNESQEMTDSRSSSRSGLGPTVKALDAMAALVPISSSDVEKQDKEDHELAQVGALAAIWDMGGHLGQRPEQVDRVLSTQAAERDPMSVGLIMVISKVVPPMASFDADGCSKATLDFSKFLIRSAESHPDPRTARLSYAIAYNTSQLHPAYAHPDFNWDTVYGPDGKTLIAAFDEWDLETMHPYLAQKLAIDAFLYSGVAFLPLAVHFGAISKAYDNFEKGLGSIARLIPDADTSEFSNLLCGALMWPTAVYSCRMNPDRCDSVANVFASAGLTWSHAAEQIDKVVDDVIFLRPRGSSDTELASQHPCELWTGIIRCNYILMARSPHVTEQEILLELPSPEEIVQLSACVLAGQARRGCMLHNNHTMANWFLACGWVAAKFNRHTEALAYAVAGLVPDHERAGTTLCTSRVLLMTIQANALAGLGRKAEAGAVFEAAADEAHRVGVFLYEVFALRDLKLHMLDGMGHSQHASRRLGVALRLLGGPAELLTPLLDGLDAADLMALPEPEPGYSYEVRFEEAEAEASEDSAATELRQELQGMRLTELRQRVMMAGVDADTIDDAIDSRDPKGAMVEILLDYESRRSGSDHEDTTDTQLRAELEELRTSALTKRAASEGIDQDEIDVATDSDDPKTELIALLLAQSKATAYAETQRREATGTELTGLSLGDLRKRAKADGMPTADLEDAMDADDPEEALRGWLVARHAPSEKSAQAARTVILAELQGLQLKDLRKRAKAGGADAVKLEEALDADDPESAVIELVLAVESEAAGADPSYHDPSEEVYETEDSDVTALRQELQGLWLKELRKRARAAGVPEDTLDDAVDSDDPKASLISVLIERHTTTSTDGSREDREYRSELEGLRYKELRARAKEANADQDEVDDAIDSDDPKAALIDLLVQHEAGAVAP